ncbi:hypothetical protein MMC21_004831 [Puttea exsequens]|nr:hypothetical protein [Puttea exsequens]
MNGGSRRAIVFSALGWAITVARVADETAGRWEREWRERAMRLWEEEVGEQEGDLRERGRGVKGRAEEVDRREGGCGEQGACGQWRESEIKRREEEERVRGRKTEVKGRELEVGRREVGDGGGEEGKGCGWGCRQEGGEGEGLVRG